MEDKETFAEDIYSESILTEEQKKKQEINEEVEVGEEGLIFKSSWIGPEILPFFGNNNNFN